MLTNQTFADLSRPGRLAHAIGNVIDKQHDHIILTDTGEVIEFCDPRIQTIKQTIEEIFNIKVHNHSLYFYGTKEDKTNTTNN